MTNNRDAKKDGGRSKQIKIDQKRTKNKAK